MVLDNQMFQSSKLITNICSKNLSIVGTRYMWNTNNIKSSFDELNKNKNIIIDEIKSNTDKNMHHLIETGSTQALNALSIANKKLEDFNMDQTSISVTFNVGILQISFTSASNQITNHISNINGDKSRH